MMKPPIIRNMMGLAKPMTASVNPATPIMGWMNSINSDVTAKCKASVTHMTMAKSKSARAECPAKLKPGVGISITAIKASIARGIPKTFRFIYVFEPPVIYK